jgi:tRNA pseudouridine38-40 synthase
VQGEVEAALARVLGEPHAVIGCGRTDAGVHAEQHVSSFRTHHAMPAADLERALDAVLPEDVGVLALRDVDPNFHAQRSACWKWYQYRILASRRSRPLRRRRTWRPGRVPSVEALNAGAAALLGKHDFASFANTGSSPTSTVRRIHRLRWSSAADEIRMDAVGDGFLYKMVRTVVGTLLQSAGEVDPEAAVRAILEAQRRAAAGPAAPAVGLTLMAVAVEGEPPPVTVPDSLQPPVDSISAAGGHGVSAAREGNP